MTGLVRLAVTVGVVKARQCQDNVKSFNYVEIPAGGQYKERSVRLTGNSSMQEYQTSTV